MDVTSERAQAYGRVVKALDDLGATKLHADEQQRIRDAADTLLFCDDATATPVRAAIEDLEDLVRHLIESGRFTEERAERLLEDVRACGPVALAH